MPTMVIVAAVDQSESAKGIVEEAGRLASAFEEPLHVVHVLDRSTFLDLERSTVEDTGKPVPVDEVRSMATEIAAEAVEDTSLNAEPVGIVGDPADEVVAYAEENNASYIVIGGRKRSPVGKALFGSVTQSILLNASLPTVTIRDE